MNIPILPCQMQSRPSVETIKNRIERHLRRLTGACRDAVRFGVSVDGAPISRVLFVGGRGYWADSFTVELIGDGVTAEVTFRPELGAI